MPLVGAAYLRCSDPRQDKSVQQQREEIERRAAADGVVIPAANWFVDEGISGRTAKKRAAYQSLLRAAEAQRDARLGRAKVRVQGIDRLYVWAFSRVARNMFDCLRALATLDEADIDVISLTEPDAGDKSFRKLIRPILAWLAERYSEELSRNVVRGMRSQAERGFWQNGHAPYGYALQRVEGGSRLVVTDETRAAFETVQRIFAEYLEGKDGQKRLAEKLTREGIEPPSREVERERFAGNWRTMHLQRILTNRTYCGHLLQNGEVLARDSHPAAVSDEDFERVAALRKLKDRNKAEGGNGNHAIHMSERGVLTPWLRCGSCGGRIAITGGGHTGSIRHYYVCSSRQENKANCAGLTVRVDKLDGAVLAYIHEETLSPANVAVICEQGAAALSEGPDEIVAERTRLTADIDALDQRVRKIGLQVVDGILGTEDAKALNAPLIDRRDAMKLRLAALPQRKQLPDAERLNPIKFRAAVLEAWSARPLEERRAALDRLVEKITLSDGGAHVDYRVKDEQIAFHQPDPSGPPWGSWGQWECRFGAPVRAPRARRPTPSQARLPELSESKSESEPHLG
jgi:DNA invertase Pin-like site-specific DNA recombinase